MNRSARDDILDASLEAQQIIANISEIHANDLPGPAVVQLAQIFTLLGRIRFRARDIRCSHPAGGQADHPGQRD